MTRSGIDVSVWQGNIDWQKVKSAGVEFALIRAGYGDTLNYPYQIDTKFEYNYKECKRVGLPVGVYFYSYATTVAMAIQEAKSCIALLKGKQLEYPVYYDVEEMSIFKTGLTNDIIKAFCTELEKAGYWVGIYIYRSAAQSYLSKAIRDRYAMAIAEYNTKCYYTDQYGIWQNSSTWRVNGISGNVDHDWCYVDYPTLIKQRGKNGFKATTTTNRIETTQDTPILAGTADKPPVTTVMAKGNQYNIDKQVKIGSKTFGKISGQNNWIDLGYTKKV